MTLLNAIKSNPKLKKIVHRLLIPRNEARPRLWVKWFLNPFIHKKGKGSKIRLRTRIDVLPFNTFKLGNHSVIEDFSTVNNGVGAVEIGDRTLIGMSNVIIGPVKIGNNVIIAQNVVISGLNHDYQDTNIPIADQPVSTAEIIIEDDCWIAANSVITAGVKIGKHCVIGAGAVVIKDVPSFSVVAGNPARLVKKYNPDTGSWERI